MKIGISNFFESKFTSGRFLLTLAAAFCFCWITTTFSKILIMNADTLEVKELLPYLATILVTLSNIFTFYFTKKSENGNHDQGTK